MRDHRLPLLMSCLPMLACLGCATTAMRPGDIDGDATFASVAEVNDAPAAARAVAAAPAAALKADAPPTDAAPTQRTVIYSAALRLTVVSLSDALNRVQALANEAGGYLDESSSHAIAIRVPVKQFDATVSRIEQLGAVVERNVKASDVTEQMIDLNIRLDTAERTRQRLLDLLAKADKIADTLKIEQELQRLTGEIESAKGKIRFLATQAAMSAIRVELNTLSAQDGGWKKDGLGLPFAWVGQLGDGLIAGNVQPIARRPGIFGAGPKFTAPPGFVRYYSNSSVVEAMDAGDLRIKVRRHDTVPDGDLAFWTALARRTLVESRAVAITGEQTTGSGDKAISTLLGSRDVAGKPYRYLLTLRRTKGRVTTFEAWGPADAFAPQEAALERAAGGI